MDESTPAEPYIIKGRDALYSITRQDLIMEYQEAIQNYREAKQRIMAIRFAVRGLSMLTGQVIPSDMDHGPILPEERLQGMRPGPVIHGPSMTAQRKAERLHTCLLCKGTGKITKAIGGEERTCPDCDGAGKWDAGALSQPKPAKQQKNEGGM